MSRWRSLARVAGHALALTTLALCVLLPTSRYDWVGDIDPMINPADLASDGGDTAVAIGAFALLSLFIEAIAIATAQTSRKRFVPLALMIVVAAAWLARSGG